MDLIPVAGVTVDTIVVVVVVLTSHVYIACLQTLHSVLFYIIREGGRLNSA